MKNIIKYKYNVLMLLGLMVALASCNRDQLFEREQYKSVFALLSDYDGFNVYSEAHDLNLAYSDGYITAAMGGSLPTDRDVTVTLVEDLSLLAKYNHNRFDVDESKYARLIPADRYTLESYTITIKAGERRGTTKISVRAGGLSPDSIYFLPLRADRFSACEINPDKSTVLYRVLMENTYARQSSTLNYTSYNFNGKLARRNGEVWQQGQQVMGEKYVFPVFGNQVRIAAGNLTLDANNAEQIAERSIILTVDENGSVSYRPVDGIKSVTPVDTIAEYPNVFRIIDDGFGNLYKTFLLNYTYTDNSGQEFNMQETLRLRYYEESKYE